MGRLIRKLALVEDGACPRRVARGRETNDPREAAESALDEVKARVAAPAARRLFAGDQHGRALDDDAKRRPVDARQVDGNLQRDVGLVDVDRGRALAGQGVEAVAAAELREDLPHLIREFTERFRRQDDGLNARSHL